MTKYKVLVIVYLISLLSSSLANSLAIDVQILYRVPLLNIRWIDVAIIIVMVSFFYKLSVTNRLENRNNFLVLLCFVYLLFEIFQLAKSWRLTDTSWQISGFICTLNFFILISLFTFKLDKEKAIEFLMFFARWGSLVTIIINAYLLYSFITGNIIYDDSDIRVEIEVIGQKETVSSSVLTPFVYAFGLYFIQKSNKNWEKALFIVAILSIFVSLVYSYHRGFLLTIFLITVIYITAFSKKPKQALITTATIAVILGVFFLAFGNFFSKKGYNPINKIVETATFAFDVNNPNWDHGRSLPLEYAISAWKDNFYIGVGYNDLHHYGLPADMGAAHNFIIASLFQRGVIGTSIYLLILFSLFRNSIKFWFVLKRKNCYQNDVLRLLIVVSFFWLIPFWTQDVIWEKYSLSIEFIYLGIITSLFKQEQNVIRI